MNRELILCIPGMWADRKDLLHQVIRLEPEGHYLFAGMILSDVETKDHVVVEFRGADPLLAKAFEIAGQGTLPADVLERLRKHTAAVYLHFPLDLPGQKERVLKFSHVLQRLGGIAVKVESAGVAHTWERWSGLLSGTGFDVYCAAVVLIGDKDYYYSCGMHHFGLPDCEVPRSVPIAEAADLMNRLNFWQIAEQPKLQPGHTFSATATAPRFRVSRQPDARHDDDHLFHNLHGLWRLQAT